jgi:putative oxidoreductase
MSHVQPSPGQGEPARRGVDADFLLRIADPLVLLARAMLAYIFVFEGIGKIATYADVHAYMSDHGVVILTELGGGLIVLFGLKTRWAAVAIAGGFLLLARFGPGAWSIDGWLGSAGSI